MSVIALSSPARAVERRPAFQRLGAIELRKMVDTRAGFWLSGGVVAATVLTVVITMLAAHPAGRTLAHVLGNAVIADAFLLPVVGILLVTSEFSQRTALTTFTLVPSRTRVLAAKVSASLVYALAAFVVCMAVSAAAVALDGGASTISGVLVPQSLLYLAIAMLTGVAFGLVMLVSAPAIVVYLLLPTVWQVLVQNLHGLRGIAHWVAQSDTLDPMVRHGLSAQGWLHALATVAVWTGLPLLIGTWRLLRRDVS